MKNVYLIAVSLLFFTIQMTATPVQTAKPKTEIAVKEKPTFKERLAHKILKKKIKKIQKQNNVKTDRLATASLIFGGLSVLSLLTALTISSLGGAILSLLFTPLSGVIGIILGAIALNRIRKDPSQNKRKTFAIIGLALGTIGAAAILIMIATGYIAS